MNQRTCHLAIRVVLTFLCVGGACAQETAPVTIPLTVPAGAPLHLALSRKVPIKHAGAPVEGLLTEPVYVFDREVIPAGTKVLGRVSKVQPVPKTRRAMAIANADFTPWRTAQVDFDRLVLNDGKEMPLNTSVTAGSVQPIHLTAGAEEKKKGRVASKVDQAKAQAKQRVHDTVQTVKAPGKMQRLEAYAKARALAELPYHRQSFPPGMHFTAELTAPLDFGTETRTASDLARLGSEIPVGSTVRARLLTPLSSADDQKGGKVEAVVSAPVLSADNHLIVPAGAKLQGALTEVVPARRFGRNGRLRFTFQQIEMPEAATRKVEASLQGVQSDGPGHVVLDSEGGAHAVTSRTRYVWPAISVLLATTSLDLDAGRHHVQTGSNTADQAGSGAMRGGVGFRLVGLVFAAGVHSRPVTAGFAFYGAAMSVYTHIVARGTDVVFSKHTPMEIGFGTHTAPASPPSAKKL